MYCVHVHTTTETCTYIAHVHTAWSTFQIPHAELVLVLIQNVTTITLSPKLPKKPLISWANKLHDNYCKLGQEMKKKYMLVCFSIESLSIKTENFKNEL